MIIYKHGDILADRAQAIVNPVNCVGVMGKGVARAFKTRYPDAYSTYRDACMNGNVKVGQMFVYDTYRHDYHRYIVHFPTKIDWRDPSKLEYIESGLESLWDTVINYDIRSIAIPALGCGNGGLDWNTVDTMIRRQFVELVSVAITIYTPL